MHIILYMAQAYTSNKGESHRAWGCNYGVRVKKLTWAHLLQEHCVRHSGTLQEKKVPLTVGMNTGH